MELAAVLVWLPSLISKRSRKERCGMAFLRLLRWARWVPAFLCRWLLELELDLLARLRLGLLPDKT
jgi:hypothetical protein